MTLYALGAVTVEKYRLRTGDTTSDAVAVSGALVEGESMLEEDLRRLLPLEERTESMVIRDNDGRMYPMAYPVIECDTNTIDGRSLLGGIPSLEEWIGWIGVTAPITARASITYTGGFTVGTLPITLEHAVYDLARALVADVIPVPVGATSVSVGDVSVSYGAPSGAGGIDALVPGISARVSRYRNRFV